MTVDMEAPSLGQGQRQPEFLSDVLKSDCASPCSQFEDCGGSSDCSEGKQEKPVKAGFWQGLFVKGLHNTLNLAFDEVYKEPEKILMIGGCRQKDFARHVALLLPAADITLVDPDACRVERAKAEICCRFKFVTSAVESMPFDDGQFDLVIAHNLPEYTGNQNAVQSEMERITSKNQGNVMLSLLNPVSMGLFGWLPGFRAGLAATGVGLNVGKFDAETLKRGLSAGGKGALSLEIDPLPWQWMVFRFDGR